MASIVEELYKNNVNISDLDITAEILKYDQLDVIDLWLLPQYPFDQWRRKYDYPRLLENIKQRQGDFTVWMQEQGILDEHLLNGYFSDFFEAKPASSDKKEKEDKHLYLVRTTWDEKMEMQIWHKYSEEHLNEFENVKHELIKPFMSYYDWLKQKGRVFSFTDTFEYYNPNTEDEQVYLNHNIRLLKMGGIRPPTNSVGILLRGKKLDFVNVSGLDLRGRIYFGSMGNLEFNHCAVNNLKCNELDMPRLHYEYCSVKNLQAINSQISHWLFYASDVSGNISDSTFDLVRIFGGQFNVLFNNCSIGKVGIEHKNHPHSKDFEKTYRAIARGAKESGNMPLSQDAKILEYDFIRAKKERHCKASDDT